MALGLIILIGVGIFTLRKKVNQSGNSLLKGAQKVSDVMIWLRFLMFLPILIIIIIIMMAAKK